LFPGEYWQEQLRDIAKNKKGNGKYIESVLMLLEEKSYNRGCSLRQP